MIWERHWSRALLGLLCAATLVGGFSCGGGIKNRKPTFAVKGKVLVQSQPAAGATLIFRPASGSTEPDEWTMGFPRATAEPDGTFTVETYGDKDGAPVGEYIVLVTWPLSTEGEDTGMFTDDGQPISNDRLGNRYMDPATSPLRAKVEAKANELPPFELN